ncbi:MAG TPA: hypothetical protein VLM79_01800 [Kofleriaceae bacterium]|nr:hypothetical protein [Kofleriaceae bacterium]
MQPIGLAVVLAFAGCGGRPSTSAAPSCPTRGPVVLASQADIRQVAPCTALPGVWIRSGAALDTSALRAQTIAGDLMIGPTVGTAEVAFGELRTIEGAVRVSSNGLLQGLFLRKLERAGRIDIDGNVALTTISLPRLTAIRGALRITDNASLEAVDLPVLESIDQELLLTGAPQLTLLDAAELQHAASVEIHAPKLPSEVTERLRAIANAR